MYAPASDGRARPLHVLVVDDSALARQTLVALLARDRALTVAVAPDPIVAREKMCAARPDVIVLDLQMPRMDGLTFLREVTRTDPIPVVVCASIDERSAEAAIRAIELGAIEVIAKPRVPARGFSEDDALLLIDAIRGAAEARVPRPHARKPAAVSVPRRWHAAGVRPVIAIGASVGGTQALATILGAVPSAAPPILIVQHMPAGFTGAFARQLGAVCPLEVREAQRGDPLMPGRVLLAPGDRHMVLASDAGRWVVDVMDGPVRSRHRPSVDVLFRSVADVAGADAFGVLLTGMGTDGADGLAQMKARGAITIAQDRATSIVFGMPRAAIDRGAVDHVLPLSSIVSFVFERIGAGAPANHAEG